MRAAGLGIVLCALAAALASRADAQSRPARAAAAPTPAEAAVAEGIALLQQNRPSDARARFEHALTLDPA